MAGGWSLHQLSRRGTFRCDSGCWETGFDGKASPDRTAGLSRSLVLPDQVSRDRGNRHRLDGPASIDALVLFGLAQRILSIRSTAKLRTALLVVVTLATFALAALPRSEEHTSE